MAVRNIGEKKVGRHNIVNHGVKETEGEKVENRIVDILDEIDEKPFVKECCRIGLEGNEYRSSLH